MKIIDPFEEFEMDLASGLFVPPSTSRDNVYQTSTGLLVVTDLESEPADRLNIAPFLDQTWVQRIGMGACWYNGCESTDTHFEYNFALDAGGIFCDEHGALPSRWSATYQRPNSKWDDYEQVERTAAWYRDLMNE